MENRRPIRIQKKEDVLRMKEESPEMSPEEECTSEGESLSELVSNDDLSEGENDLAKEKNARKKCVSEHREKWGLLFRHLLFAWSLISCLFIGYLLYRVNQNCFSHISTVEKRAAEITRKVSELEALFNSKYKEVDVADYLEGARIMHDISTEAYFVRKFPFWKSTKGLNAEVAIDRIIDKHHCYSFAGSEGKLGIAFKNEKIIQKVGIAHPLYDSRSSAVKNFSVDCLVGGREVHVGDFEYEIPGDSFQQFPIPPTACTGIIFRIKSNHGRKEYTCIYKVYAFE
ncbi:uncharacterized protein NEMAJ01_1913 [Nematocida major]|uniref:uncharacterized protein n=1 Tax=Nematocida major TaxID=1912982 RepID=UPI002007BDBD|nr:uncharacterized protein NEMAJ01_1913 [Nematocida major]KAH9387017.1 hypothetical protein NEMAJ01_1913 [Nematocida major]